MTRVPPIAESFGVTKNAVTPTATMIDDLRASVDSITVETVATASIAAAAAISAEAAQRSGGPPLIGGYSIFVDSDGSLKIAAPDGSLTTLAIASGELPPHPSPPIGAMVIGGYAIYVENSGGLSILAPDGSTVPLMVKS